MSDRRFAGLRWPRLGRVPRILAAALAALATAGVVWLAVAPRGGRPPAPAPGIAARPPPVAAPAPPKPAPPPAPVPVSSMPEAETYPLAQWSAATVPSGVLDRIALDGAPLDPAKAKLLVADDVLTVTGWAGDRVLGIRFPDVVLSLCGRVVASVPVELDRPDIARTVHPNLGRSGWSARLLVGHLPRCPEETLAAWGVAPFGRVLFPLAGETRLDLPPAEPPDPAMRVETRPLLRPRDMPNAPQEVSIAVAGAVHVRSCASIRCGVAGELRRGRYLAGLLDRANGWALVVVPKRATGWLAERVVTIEPVSPR